MSPEAMHVPTCPVPAIKAVEDPEDINAILDGLDTLELDDDEPPPEPEPEPERTGKPSMARIRAMLDRAKATVEASWQYNADRWNQEAEDREEGKAKRSAIRAGGRLVRKRQARRRELGWSEPYPLEEARLEREHQRRLASLEAACLTAGSDRQLRAIRGEAPAYAAVWACRERVKAAQGKVQPVRVRDMLAERYGLTVTENRAAAMLRTVEGLEQPGRTWGSAARVWERSAATNHGG